MTCWPRSFDIDFGDEARDRVGRAAGREGHDHGDGALGIVLAPLVPPGERSEQGRWRRQSEQGVNFPSASSSWV